MTITNSADNTSYPVSLIMNTDYHSIRDFVIPYARFESASFNILNYQEYKSIKYWWCQCRQINNEMQLELYAKIPDGQWILAMSTNPETTSSQEWYMTTSEINNL